jgi:fermentation-respiration switch protein FrsA (DUF1100 family)
MIVAYFAIVAIAVASYVNFHDSGGYAHGLADGDNNNGYVRDYIHRDNGANAYLYTRRFQSGTPLSLDSCASCATLDRGIYPSINECHESVAVEAFTPTLAWHTHLHANYCG